MIICIRISPFNLYCSIRKHKCHFEKKWHYKTAAVYLFTDMVLPILQPAYCKIRMFWASIS